MDKRYCPARWIPLKIGSFDRYLLNREARRFLEKSVRPPSCEIPLKLQRRLVQMLAMEFLRTPLYLRPVLLHTTVGKGAMN